ncbi:MULTISPECIES: stage II sporulation protein D [unclassified Candidatus Frackibacter]|nr:MULTISPECIES: stage II sporulation protein D [unclassified Candidatus Frackibacter]SDC10189.1 stage II sporulation protein D [Candidatus Frackibacter sp. WG11]SFL42766.1 stage II sporulation protein D [Candidatus Frackibacter sp. WG13]
MIFNLITLLGIPTVLIKGLSELRNNKQITVKVKISEDQVLNLSLEEYLKGVVAAEMPASFNLEALKAQAVAARTYALRRVQGSGSRVIRISADSNIDQAWLSKSELLQKWGSLKYWLKISKAVEETSGVFLTYDGQIILAAYHSASGARTAMAKNVWGKNVPYLQVVSSPYEDSSPYNHYEMKYTLDEFADKIGLKSWEERNNLKNKIQIISRSRSGRVLSIRIADEILTGREVRDRLNLKSTNFTYQISNDYIKFITKGNGHGVGMSQYGANGMARAGYDYLEILKHYYPGAKVKRLAD